MHAPTHRLSSSSTRRGRWRRRASPSAPKRLARAKRAALDAAASLGDVPVGVATFTDRVLPILFPTANRAAFDSAVEALTIEDPPPRDVNTVATSFGALAALGTQGFFPSRVHKRAAIVVTDGESRPFDPGTLASTLSGHGIRLAVVPVGTGGDRVFRPDGKPEARIGRTRRPLHRAWRASEVLRRRASARRSGPARAT